MRSGAHGDVEVRPPEQVTSQDTSCAAGDANAPGVAVDGTMPTSKSNEFQQRGSGASGILAHTDSNPSIKPAVVLHRSIPGARSGARHSPLWPVLHCRHVGVFAATPFVLLHSQQVLKAKEVTGAAAAVKLCL